MKQPSNLYDYISLEQIRNYLIQNFHLFETINNLFYNRSKKNNYETKYTGIITNYKEEEE